ncbi:MAG: hypothetical protein ACKPEY_14175, partial [Planctomycetota bacterium]
MKWFNLECSGLRRIAALSVVMMATSWTAIASAQDAPAKPEAAPAAAEAAAPAAAGEAAAPAAGEAAAPA